MSKYITILCLFLVIEWGTGYIIYIKPHFGGLFISTRDSSLTNALITNSYLRYFETYHEDFKNFIVKNDSLPAFIKYDKDIDIYNFGTLDQGTIHYFRVAIKIKEPRSSYQYIEPGKDVKTVYYMQNKQTGKITYLHRCIKSEWSVLHCEDYKLL